MINHCADPACGHADMDQTAQEGIGRRTAAATATPSGDDPSVLAGLRSVGGEGFVGFEMLLALDRETELAANFAEFVEADEAKLLGPSVALALRVRLLRFKTAVPF